MTETGPAMTSHRPYLLRALYEWIADNDMTPHLLVDAARSGVQVPPHAIQDGRVVLNIAERAVAGLQMDNALISFSARFGGISQNVRVPVGAVLAIYARETGQGMALPEDPGAAEPEQGDPARQPPGRPGLSAVPDRDDEGGGAEAPAAPAAGRNDGGSDGGGDDDGPDSPGPRRGGHLRIVK